MGTNIMHVCNSVIPAFVRRYKDSSAFMRTWGPSGQALDVVPFSTIKLHKTEAWKQMGTLQVGMHYAPENKWPKNKSVFTSYHHDRDQEKAHLPWFTLETGQPS